MTNADDRATLEKVLDLLAASRIPNYDGFASGSYRDIPALLAALRSALQVPDAAQALTDLRKRVYSAFMYLPPDGEAIAWGDFNIDAHCRRVADEFAIVKAQRDSYKREAAQARREAIAETGNRIADILYEQRALECKGPPFMSRSAGIWAALSLAADVALDVGAGTYPGSRQTLAAQPAARGEMEQRQGSPAVGAGPRSREATDPGDAGSTPAPGSSPPPDDAAERADLIERANAWLAQRDEEMERELPRERTCLDRELELVGFALSEIARLRQPPAPEPEPDVFYAFARSHHAPDACIEDAARDWFQSIIAALEFYAGDLDYGGEARRALAQLRARAKEASSG